MASWVPPSLFVISSTAAVIGWTIPCGILFPFWPGYVRLAEPYHVVSLKSRAAPKCGIWVNIVSFLSTIQMSICYVVCLIITNTWIHISLYIRNTAILENNKISLNLSTSTCDLHLFRLLKCAICRTIPVKMMLIDQLSPILKFYYISKSIFWKSGLVKLVYSWICRHENIKVILYVQLWQLGTQRLDQGLSETILANTLTDVRQFKNTFYTIYIPPAFENLAIAYVF